MLGTLERSTILRLRVFDRNGSDLDPLALRGRLQNVLSDVSLEPRLKRVPPGERRARVWTVELNRSRQRIAEFANEESG